MDIHMLLHRMRGGNLWSTAGKPVRMNVARGGGDQVNEGLMSSNGILLGVN